MCRWAWSVSNCDRTTSWGTPPVHFMCAFIRKNSWLRVRFHTVLELTYCPLPCCKNWPFPITFLQCAPLHLHWQLWSWSGSKAWAEGRVTHLLEHSWKASRGRAMGLSFQCWRGGRDNTWGHGSGVKPAALKAQGRVCGGEDSRHGGCCAFFWGLTTAMLSSENLTENVTSVCTNVYLLCGCKK